MCNEVNENNKTFENVTSDEASAIFCEQLAVVSDGSRTCRKYYKELAKFYRKRSKKDNSTTRRVKAIITVVN